MEKDSNVEKVIPLKNYIVLSMLFIGIVMLTGYFCNWYHVYDEYQRQTPIIRGTLSEITAEEINHYITDNPTAVFYMCTANDFNCRNYEKDLKKLVISEDLQNSIIYVNLSDIDSNVFVDNFNNTYTYKVKLTTNYPAFVVFNDGKITNILQGNEKNKLTIGKTRQFIDINKIGD